MIVVVIGTGYVGLVTGACLASLGFKIICIDENSALIKQLQNKEIPIYEPGLANLITTYFGNITFTSDKKLIELADIIIITVDTPSLYNGSVNTDSLFNSINDISKALVNEKERVVMIKSTVPVGTAKHVRSFLETKNNKLSVVSTPEFLREGSAVNDFLKPERVVVGYDNDSALIIIKKLYQSWIDKKVPFIFTDNDTAELIKYVANSYLAMRVSYVNQINDIAVQLKVDSQALIKAVSLDSRIGKKYFKPGPWFGGSCLPKDTRAFINIANSKGVSCSIIEKVVEYNDKRKNDLIKKIISLIDSKASNFQEISILGLTFKRNTDDIRDSPGVYLTEQLLERGYKIRIYDPKGMKKISQRKFTKGSITFCSSKYKAIQNCKVIIIATDWKEFSMLDFNKLKNLAGDPLIIDLCLTIDPNSLRKNNLSFYSLGYNM